MSFYSGDSFVKPMLKVGSYPQTLQATRNATRSPSSPNIELTIRPNSTVPSDHTGFSIHATSSGLKLNRQNGREQNFGEGNPGTFGMKSWYDVGSSGRGKDRGGDGDGDDDLLWFKQRTIGQSVCMLVCCFPNDYNAVERISSGAFPELHIPRLRHGH